MTELPDAVKTMFHKKTFVHFATLMKGGGPHVSAVWVDVDGDHVLINSAQGRLKDRNVRRDARVALSAIDPDNPYHSVTVRGRVIDITTEGADAHIDAMAKKYMDVDAYPYRTPEEVRVIYRIEAERISVMGE